MDGSYLDRWASWVPRRLVTASPVLVIARELGPSASLFTVSGGGSTAFERSPRVARYLVEVRVPGGHAC